MPDLFDTRGIKDDPAHWEALAERVAREAARRSRSSQPPGVGSLAASRAALIAASLLLAASLAFMTMSSRQNPRPMAELGQALAPGDDVGRAFALTGRPPAVAALLFTEPRVVGGQP